MTIFVGDDFVMLSSSLGDVILTKYGRTVLYTGADESVIMDGGSMYRAVMNSL